MLLYIPSIVVNAVLVALAIYAMWTRGVDLRTTSVAPAASAARRPLRQEAFAA